MKTEGIKQLFEKSEGAAIEFQDIECWSAREENRPVADFLPTISIKSKDLAA